MSLKCFIKFWAVTLLMVFGTAAIGQETDKEDIATYIVLDDVVVKAQKKGFDVEEFIEFIQNDSTFYEAFTNLRKTSYIAENSMQFVDKKERVTASYQSVVQQTSNGLCRTMKFLSESADGNFFKRQKKYRYYTAKMFDRVFYTHEKTCDTQESLEEEEKAKGMQKHYNELKKLIFQTGKRVEVPFIGGRTAIFDPKLIPYYNFSIQSKNYVNGEDCYVFVVEVKPEFQERKQGKTIIKFLETYIEKKTFQVVARKYQLLFYGVFDFDVTMEVELTKAGQLFIPKKIRYDGFWNIPMKKREEGSLEILFRDFQLN